MKSSYELNGAAQPGGGATTKAPRAPKPAARAAPSGSPEPSAHMTRRWVKKGLMFSPPTDLPWMRTHAALPVVLDLGDDRFRVYFTGRDAENRSHIGSFEFHGDDPMRVMHVSRRPVLSPGALGTFDEFGVTTSCIAARHGKLYLYYSGWNRGVSVPFHLAIGLAVSVDGGRTFERYSRGPIIDRGPRDACMTASPCVFVEARMWRMWYVSCPRWRLVDGQPRHNYHIQYAESPDGIDWKRDGTVCIGFKNDREYAIARPCVIREGGIYRMWYCYRGDRYRIGYAESPDGVQWTRLDERAGIDRAESGWDARMIAYPAVFDHRDKRYMLYNGNDYGRTGIGLAQMV